MIPLWYRRHVVQPYGARMPKKPKPPIWVKPGDAKPLEGNLQSWEYQFWIGDARETSNWSQCRACGVACWTKESRQEHFATKKHSSQTSCAVKTICALQLLQDSKRCVSCGLMATTEKWLAPFCSNPFCKKKWMYAWGNEKSLVFQAALTAAERLGWLRRHERKMLDETV